VARLAVAATAPFGADVLERLAAEEDVVRLLTRPDKPRGRGRPIAPPPAKEVADRLGIAVDQPTRLDESVELAADGASLRPRPRGASRRVSSCTTSWFAASRSSTSAPNGAVAATPMRN